MKIFRQITANDIKLVPYDFKKELAMEAYLMENEEILKLDENNFAEVTVLDAELALKEGQKTSNRDGRIDILASYGTDYLSIVELKKDEINENTLNQLEDYLKQKEQILKKYPKYWNNKENPPNWVGVLVGSSISPELQRLLEDGYETSDGIPIAAMVIRRFRSNRNEIFVITDTYFNYGYTARDFAKFKFRGETYNKSRLVNKVLKTYVGQNQNITFAELENKFPEHLQGSNGVFTTQDKAQRIYDQTGHKRYYIKSDELITLSDSTIATCNQWGKDNLKKFIEHVNNNLDSKFNIENI